jgi:glycosyl transferase family 25
MENKHMPNRKTALSYFDAIFLINLKRRPDRLAKARAQLFNQAIEEFWLYPAVDGTELDYKGPLNAGQMGCTLSHLGIIKYAKANNLDKIFIFEDDIEMTDNFNEVIAAAIAELPTDWCMFFAGANHVKKVKPFSNHLVKLEGSYCAQAYAIHSRFYDTIINLVEKEYNQVIDDYYFVHLQPKYPCFCATPKVAFQAKGYSDLQYQVVDYSEMLKN